MNGVIVRIVMIDFGEVGVFSLVFINWKMKFFDIFLFIIDKNNNGFIMM